MQTHIPTLYNYKNFLRAKQKVTLIREIFQYEELITAQHEIFVNIFFLLSIVSERPANLDKIQLPALLFIASK